MKIAIGVFDGVHRGHQKVIEKAHRVVTFDPHPHPLPLLTTVSERQDLIGNLDILKFTKNLAELSPEDFIKKHIVKPYAPEAIIVGHDFVFGHGRAGNVQTLKTLGQKYNFTVEEVPEYCHQGQPVRSSTIRELLSLGKITAATELLGRDYQLNGTVAYGEGVGHQLGFPTINIQLENKQKLIPGHGVYSGEAIILDKLYRCAIFIGQRQTFNGKDTVIEAHLLDFNEQAYTKNCTLFIQKFLRPEQKFPNREALIEQIKKDVQQIQQN